VTQRDIVPLSLPTRVLHPKPPQKFFPTHPHSLCISSARLVWFARIAPSQLPISSSELVRALRVLSPLRAIAAVNMFLAPKQLSRGVQRPLPPTPRILDQQ
jgi:hypothetical protein